MRSNKVSQNASPQAFESKEMTKKKPAKTGRTAMRSITGPVKKKSVFSSIRKIFSSVVGRRKLKEYDVAVHDMMKKKVPSKNKAKYKEMGIQTSFPVTTMEAARNVDAKGKAYNDSLTNYRQLWDNSASEEAETLAANEKAVELINSILVKQGSISDDVKEKFKSAVNSASETIDGRVKELKGKAGEASEKISSAKNELTKAKSQFKDALRSDKEKEMSAYNKSHEKELKNARNAFESERYAINIKNSQITNTIKSSIAGHSERLAKLLEGPKTEDLAKKTQEMDDYTKGLNAELKKLENGFNGTIALKNILGAMLEGTKLIKPKALTEAVKLAKDGLGESYGNIEELSKAFSYSMKEAKFNRDEAINTLSALAVNIDTAKQEQEVRLTRLQENVKKLEQHKNKTKQEIKKCDEKYKNKVDDLGKQKSKAINIIKEKYDKAKNFFNSKI